MPSPTKDSVQRSRTFAVLAPITFSDNKYHHRFPNGYSSLQHVASLPSVASNRVHAPYVGPPHRPSPFRRPIRDWDLWDDYWADRRYYMSPLYWPNHSHIHRRYYYLDPPYNIWWNYPAIPWWPKGNNQVAQMEQVDPLYSRRYRDPNYDRPVWQPSRPWPHETGYRLEPRRMLQMYRQKLIDYDQLLKDWLTPFSLDRKVREYDTQADKDQAKEKERMIRATSVARSANKH